MSALRDILRARFQDNTHKMNAYVEFVNIPIAAIMLLFTSYLDIQKREVEDKVWLGFGGVGVIVQALEVYSGYSNLEWLLISVGVAALIGLGIFFFGFYGGADGKALIVLAVLVPILQPKVGIYTLAPIMTLSNGILISVLLPFGLAILNLVRILRGEKIFAGFDQESMPKKVLACFLGYRASGKPRDFQFPMEKQAMLQSSSNAEQKKFDFSFMGEEFETKPGTWVTPGIPLLVFFTAGFFMLLIYGDLVIGLVQFFAKGM
jgi:archaeal preflagellin peptidase FlaK